MLHAKGRSEGRLMILRTGNRGKGQCLPRAGRRCDNGRAARAYPWPQTYDAFPGPNSNTFTAWVARQVPELGLKLPISAIGSGFVN